MLHKRMALLGFLLAIGLLVQAQNSDRKYVSSKQVENRLEVIVSDGIIVFTPYSGNAMDVEFIAKGIENPPSFGIAALPSAESSRLKEDVITVKFTHKSLSVKIVKSPFHIVYYYNNNPFLTEEDGYFDSTDVKGFRMRLEDSEKLMGGGERVLGMDRRGNRLRLYNKASYGYETKADVMYYSLPIAMRTMPEKILQKGSWILASRL